MRLTAPQRRALREIQEGRVAQDRVARIYLDETRVREPREKTYRSLLFWSLARHRKSDVSRKGRFIAIDLTDAGAAAT